MKKSQMKSESSEEDYLKKLIEKWSVVLSRPLSAIPDNILLESRETWKLKDEQD